MLTLNWFRDRPFKIKIALLITLAVSTAIAMVSAGFVFFEIGEFKKNLESERLNLLRVVGANLTAAILFDDTNAIEETLSVFEELPEVRSVALFSAYGEIKSQYFQASGTVSADPTLAPIGEFSKQTVVFDDGHLIVQVPIYVDEELIGALQATTTLQQLRNKIEYHILIAAAITVFAIWVAFLIGQLFGKFLARPIEELTQTMAQVKRTNNYELSACVISNDELGKLTVSFNEMLTEIRHRDEKLEQTVAERTHELVTEKERVEAASKAKSSFLANMSHELRTPMNGVMGMAELMANTELTEKQKMFADTIYRSGSALMTILNDILDFSKIEAEKLELDPTAFALGAAIEDVATLLRTAADKKEIELIVRCAPSLPKIVEGDVGRIRQVLTNLVGNAIKFTHEGHVLIDISGAMNNERVSLHISIEDTGIGIAPDMVDAVFQSFTQAESSTTRKFGGTGLGLAISRSLVEMMGGKIGVTSDIGLGSTFWFELELPVIQEQSSKCTSAIDFKNRTFLIVANASKDCQALAAHIKSLDGEAVMVDNDAEALDALRAAEAAGRSFTMALIAHHMPKVDGLSLVRKIRSEPKPAWLPLIILSSVDDDVEAKKFRDLGVNEYIVKPSHTASLKDVILEMVTDMQVGSLRSVVNPKTSQPEKSLGSDAPQATLKGRILVAEDNVVNRMVMENMIDGEQYDVVFAENGKEAYDAFRNDAFDLIFMDISMPVMDGIEAVKAIRSHEHKLNSDRTPIVALTAHAMNGDKRRFLDAGMDDYVSKPVKKIMLDEVVCRWLAQQNSSHDLSKMN